MAWIMATTLLRSTVGNDGRCGGHAAENGRALSDFSAGGLATLLLLFLLLCGAIGLRVIAFMPSTAHGSGGQALHQLFHQG
jgi:hypothetical protein